MNVYKADIQDWLLWDNSHGCYLGRSWEWICLRAVVQWNVWDGRLSISNGTFDYFNALRLWYLKGYEYMKQYLPNVGRHVFRNNYGRFFFLSYCMLKCKTFEGFLDYVVHDCGVRSQQKLASNSSIILFAGPLWDHYVLLNWCILMCRILIWLLIQSLITVLLSSQGHQCHHHNLHRLLRRIIIPTHRILV